MASLPGWHATIDGRPLTLSPYLSMMFQAHIPPGRHVIELSYWPRRFTEGIVLAALAVIGLVIAAIVAWRRSIALASGMRVWTDHPEPAPSNRERRITGVAADDRTWSTVNNAFAHS